MRDLLDEFGWPVFWGLVYLAVVIGVSVACYIIIG